MKSPNGHRPLSNSSAVSAAWAANSGYCEQGGRQARGRRVGVWLVSRTGSNNKTATHYEPVDVGRRIVRVYVVVL